MEILPTFFIFKIHILCRIAHIQIFEFSPILYNSLIVSKVGKFQEQKLISFYEYFCCFVLYKMKCFVPVVNCYRKFHSSCFLCRFLQDHSRSNLIWNFKTREELRDTLETEMRAFQIDRELGSANVISWNHHEFEVCFFNSLCFFKACKVPLILSVCIRTWTH